MRDHAVTGCHPAFFILVALLAIQVVAANRNHAELRLSNVDGSGHQYWVDKTGFTTQDQTDLIQFLLSLDDDPEVLLTSK